MAKAAVRKDGANGAGGRRDDNRPQTARASADSVSAVGCVAPPTRILRVPVVCERTGLSRTSLWRLTRRGDFPASRQLSPGTVGWLEHEVEAWLASRPIKTGATPS